MNHQNNKPKFYRQRFLLSLLYYINREITRTDLHKHSFLFSSMGYDFLPFKYGCYSFQLDKDLLDLSKQNFIKISNNKIKLVIDCNPITWLKVKDSNRLFTYPEEQRQLKGDDLIALTYKKYPYYAINSEIINRICQPHDKQKIQEEKSAINSNKEIIYTIGYEGISIEIYINKLIKNNIKLLCDVRKNPFSRKFGFSSKTLSNILSKLNIDYAHIPQLGIESYKRQNLNDKKDYKKLFAEYKITLPSKQKALYQVINLQKQYKRIALTCFEKHHNDCHRHCVSDYLTNNYKTKIIHL